MNVMNIWSTPIAQFTWEHHDKHRDNLVKLAYELEAQNYKSGVADSIKRGLYESGFDFLISSNPSVQALSDWAKDCVWAVSSSLNQKHWKAGDKLGVRIHESWCHITRSGGYHDVHQHPGSSWSGIFYIDPGESSSENRNGVNRFYNPQHIMYTDPGTDWIAKSTSVDILPTAGQLIIFPSWILHSAMPYFGEKDRVIMAFNSQIIKG